MINTLIGKSTKTMKVYAKLNTPILGYDFP